MLMVCELCYSIYFHISQMLWPVGVVPEPHCYIDSRSPSRILAAASYRICTFNPTRFSRGPDKSSFISCPKRMHKMATGYHSCQKSSTVIDRFRR